MRTLEEEVGINKDRQVIKVVHANLKRVSDSMYKSACPVCFNGVLLVYRDETNGFRLLAQDRCICCGQLFEYIDIDDVE